jgi:hypothetical protein
MAAATLGIALFPWNEIIARSHIYRARCSIRQGGSTNAASLDTVVGGKENLHEH